MKKFILLVITGCCWFFNAASQAKPYYTSYILNNYILNPALSGIENYTDIKASYRHQWVGINGAPVTAYFSAQGPIDKKDLRTNVNSYEIPGENPRGKKYWDEYAVSPPHHGIGFSAINDKAGYINRWTISGSYAYHKPLSAKTALSAGISAGITSVNLDRSKVDFGSGPQNDPNDLAIGFASGDLKKLMPELGVGLWLYSKNYFVGVSVLDIVPNRVKFVNTATYGTYFEPNFFATAGYRFFMTDDISVLPSVMVQYWEPQLTGVHANVKLQYRDQLWIGGSYRFSDLISGYSGMVGLNISNTFNISYAYENATTSRLKTYTQGTHEIVLGFILGNKYGDTCPRNIW